MQPTPSSVASPDPRKHAPRRLCFVGHMLGRRAGFVTSQGLILAGLFERDGYQVLCVSDQRTKVMRLLDTVFTLARRLPEIDVAVVETYGGPSFILAAAASWMVKRFGRPLVLVLHGGALPTLIERFPRWTESVLRRARVLVAPSDYLARCAPEGVEVRIIPNVIDLSCYQFEERRRVRPRLLWMRSFQELYNPMMALRVLSRLKHRYPDATLTMAGQDKGMLAQVQEQAAALGLANAVRFPGFLDLEAKLRETAAADIFVNTNRIDNTPVAILEAGARGLPVVSTDVGGIRDLLRNEQTGLIVPDGDDEEMAAAVARLVEEPALAHRLSVNGRDLAARSSWEPVRAQWIDLFDRLSSR